MSAARRPAMSNAMLGTLIFVSIEAMFFAGLVSAYLITKAGARDWPPSNQPRLPIAVTGLTTTALVLSGAMVVRAGRLARSPSRRASAEWWWAGGVGLGAFFVLVQGMEWVRLIAQGLTLTSSRYGGFFYVLVGAHGVHALGGLAVLVWAGARVGGGRLAHDALSATRTFWGFVVALWPLLYVLVYLL